MEKDESNIVSTPTYPTLSKPPVDAHMLAHATAVHPVKSEPTPPVPSLPTSTKKIVQTATIPIKGLEEENEKEPWGFRTQLSILLSVVTKNKFAAQFFLSYSFLVLSTYGCLRAPMLCVPLTRVTFEAKNLLRKLTMI